MHKVHRAYLIIIGVLSFLGFADSAYLTADHYFKLPLPCSITQGCETVLTSPYAMIGFLPVAALGVAYYLAILFITVHHYTSEASEKKLAWAVFFISGAGVLASLYFLYLQAFVIHAFCQYCLGSAATSLLTFIVSGFFLRSFASLIPEDVKNGS